MSYPGNLLALEIERVMKDDLGPYAKIKVAVTDGDIVIRWGLDNPTYENLKKFTFSPLTSFRSNEHYKCFIAFDTVHDNQCGWITCQLGNQTTRLSFPCSSLYQANLEWLRNIESVEELRSLAWNGWVESYYNISGMQSLEDIPLTFKHPIARGRNLNRPFVWVVTIVIALGFLGWYGVSLSRHRNFHTLSLIPNGTAVGTGKETAIHPRSAPSNVATGNQMYGNTSSAENTNSLFNTTAAVSTNATKTQPLDNSAAAQGHVTPQTAQPYPEVYEVPYGEVALTFDDGPSPQTHELLQILMQYHVPATFFFVSTNVDRWPEAVEEAADNGFEIGDHTVNHGDLITMSKSQQQWEIEASAKDIEQYTHTPIELFRPPYDDFNNTTEALLAKDHMALALWNRDPKDWQASTSDQVISQVLKLNASGGVFILHDKPETVAALPTIIQALQAQHLKFVLLPVPAQFSH